MSHKMIFFLPGHPVIHSDCRQMQIEIQHYIQNLPTVKLQLYDGKRRDLKILEALNESHL